MESKSWLPFQAGGKHHYQSQWHQGNLKFLTTSRHNSSYSQHWSLIPIIRYMGQSQTFPIGSPVAFPKHRLTVPGSTFYINLLWEHVVQECSPDNRDLVITVPKSVSALEAGWGAYQHSCSLVTGMREDDNAMCPCTLMKRLQYDLNFYTNIVIYEVIYLANNKYKANNIWSFVKARTWL